MPDRLQKSVSAAFCKLIVDQLVGNSRLLLVRAAIIVDPGQDEAVLACVFFSRRPRLETTKEEFSPKRLEVVEIMQDVPFQEAYGQRKLANSTSMLSIASSQQSHDTFHTTSIDSSEPVVNMDPIGRTLSPGEIDGTIPATIVRRSPSPQLTTALPRIQTAFPEDDIDRRARLPRGASLPATAQQRQNSAPATERGRNSSFFGIQSDRISPGRYSDYSEAPRERTSSTPAPPRSERRTYLGDVQEYPLPSGSSRPSSFYGLEGHVNRRNSDQDNSRRNSPSPNNMSMRRSLYESNPSAGSARSDYNLPHSNSRSPSLHGVEISNLSALLDQSHLQPGEKASLLSHAKTLELYRTNAKKTNDPELMFDFANLMLTLAKELPDFGDELDIPDSARHSRRPSGVPSLRQSSPSSSSSSIGTPLNKSPPLDGDKDAPTSALSESELPITKRNALYTEAATLLKKLSHQGHLQAQALLADLYLQGVLNPKGKQDYDRAFPLFVQAAKQGDANGAYKAAQCCEHAWGCRKDWANAVQWYRKACASSHPAAMYRLGIAEIRGELNLSPKPKEGFKWLKRASELADQPEPSEYSIKALHELGLLHERGIEHVVFVDTEYAAECFAKASELGYALSAYKLGVCYEYGRMGCPQDSALSIHYYNIAAQQDHREACFALTAWYLVGSPGVLPQSDTEAYLWAKRAAEDGLAKAEYAVGYFTEMGMGTPKDLREAMTWYQRSADHGDDRAVQRLSPTYGDAEQSYPDNIEQSSVPNGSAKPRSISRSKKEGECIIS